MPFFFCYLLAAPAEPPLLGNNLDFYTVFGAVLLLLLLPLILWMRGRPDKSESDNINTKK